ncbi:MAG: hypothetical protein PHG75_03060 [Syntrophomonas sp.]|nr:hypothetical protein [Syntrophomonas sp.]
MPEPSGINSIEVDLVVGQGDVIEIEPGLTMNLIIKRAKARHQ